MAKQAIKLADFNEQPHLEDMTWCAELQCHISCRMTYYGIHVEIDDFVTVRGEVTEVKACCVRDGRLFLVGHAVQVEHGCSQTS